MKYILCLLVITFSFLNITTSYAQEDSDLVEVYGLVVSKNDAGVFEFIPFATVAVEGTTRGTYANYEGVYSIVVKKGQTIKVTAVGFETREIKIPTDIVGLYHSLSIQLNQAVINIEEITVFPWPDRNNLTAEFLAMQPTRAMELQAIAKDNLDKNELLAIAASTNPDGKESASHYLRKQTSDYSYKGQVAPQPIFDPLAWGKFFKQWKKKELSAKEKRMLEMLENESSGDK